MMQFPDFQREALLDRGEQQRNKRLFLWVLAAEVAFVLAVALLYGV